jgi:hypothetical protein
MIPSAATELDRARLVLITLTFGTLIRGIWMSIEGIAGNSILGIEMFISGTVPVRFSV